MNKRILLMHISQVSGHRSASNAVEKAVKTLKPEAETLNINAFNYTNPVWERIIHRAYMGVVKNTPEIWDYLYDNPRVLKRTRRIRELIHRSNTGKLKSLFDEFRPDVVACTQAYPCGMFADYKKTFNLNTPLIGILTDFAPHSYWIYDNVDAYVVPSQETGQRLVRNGVLEEKIRVFGIPINPKFIAPLDKDQIREELKLDKNIPTILVMGGGHGLGSIKQNLLAMDRIRQNFQVLVVAGINKRLYDWVRKTRFKKNVRAFGYIDFIEKLMQVSTLIITKPGGITTAEALSKSLPMIIVDPLPGQEAMNTRFLLEKEIAIRSNNKAELADLLDWLLDNPGKLKQMSQNARAHAKPESAVRTAELILNIT